MKRCEPLYIETTCPICHETHSIMVFADDYLHWKHGVEAQDAFEYLSADDREMLISGICPKCWDDLFADEDEEDYDEPADLEIGFDPYMGCYTEDC